MSPPPGGDRLGRGGRLPLMRVSGVVGFAAAVVALIAIALPALASADEADAPVTVTTVLQPGHNFVGWIAEPIAVEDIFAEIEAAALVYRWDADSGVWRFAIRGVGGTLARLEPGMAARINIGGEEPVEWERPLTPVKGLVELRSGENWVAWSGRDDWSIADVAKGIGKSLTEVRSGGLIYSPARPETAEDWPSVMRGDALKVTVSRAVNWLQPTGLMPDIEWGPDTTTRQQTDALGNLEEVIRYFSESYGIEADASGYIIRIHDDPNHTGGEVQCTGDESLSDGPPLLFIRTSYFASPTRISTTLLHEYVHVLQCQLRGAYDHPSVPMWLPPSEPAGPLWLVEGTAVNEEAKYASIILGTNPTVVEWSNPTAVTLAPPLQQMEVTGYHGYHYPLGALAARQLADLAGKGSWLEFYRLQAISRIGPNYTWVSVPNWRDAFQIAFGVEIDAFYESFSILRESHDRLSEGWVNVAGRIPGLSSSATTPMELLLGFGDPEDQTDRFVTHVPVQRDGSFAFGAPTDKANKLFSVLLRAPNLEQCSWLYDNDTQRFEPFPRWPASKTWPDWELTLSSEELETLAFPRPEYAQEIGCVQIGGTVVDENGEPLPGVRVRVIGTEYSPGETPTRPSPVSTRADGTFSFSVWKGRTYIVEVNLAGSQQFPTTAADSGRVYPRYRYSRHYSGCTVYYAGGSVTDRRHDALPVSTFSIDPPKVVVRLDDESCSSYVQGAIAGLDRRLHEITRSEIHARKSVGRQIGPDRARALIGPDSEFGIALPTTGRYVVSVDIGGCEVYYRDGGATAIPGEATRIEVGREGVENLDFSVPTEMCDIVLSGRLNEPASGGLTWRFVQARLAGTSYRAGAQIDADGRFALTLAYAGDYELYASTDGCSVRVHESGVDPEAGDAIYVGVNGMSNVGFWIPARACSTRIAGVLLDAKGNGIGNTTLYVWNGLTSGDSTATEADGSFTYTVPTGGTYRFGVGIDGCLVFHGARGPTINWDAAAQIVVGETGVEGVVFRYRNLCN